MVWRVIVTLAIGLLSGWIANGIMGARGGLVRNIVMGLVGSVVGGIVAGLFGIYATSWIGSIVISIVGACLFLFIARLFTHTEARER